MQIQIAKTPEEIIKCWQVLKVLRPHLDKDGFVPLLQEMIREGYVLAFIEKDGIAVSAAGYRYQQYLYIGKHYKIDDLSTLASSGGNGYGGMLIDYICNEARDKGYAAVMLNSGHGRHIAHRLYLNKGFVITDHHFIKKL